METYFTLTQEADADNRVDTIYKDVKEKFQITFIPSFFKAMAFHEHVFAGVWDGYKSLLVKGIIPTNIKEMIFLTVAISKGCNYCSSTHLAVCDMLEVSKENIQSILEDVDNVSPERIKLILKYSLSIINSPHDVTEDNYNEMLQVGITEEEIVDIIGITILSNTAVNIAQSMGLDVEEEINQYLTTANLSTGLPRRNE